MRSVQLSCFLSLLLLACEGPSAGPPPFEAPGPGLIYTFPFDGQLDVPLSSRVTLAFSEAIDTSVLSQSCSSSGQGALCLLSGSSLVAGTWTPIGDQPKAVEFTPDAAFAPGQEYELHISPQLLAAGVGNVPASGPAMRFTAQRPGNQVGVAATIIAINGDPAAAFEAGSAIKPRFPMADFVTFRAVFSEEIDERTAILGQTVMFVESASQAPVAGQLRARGLHLSFDPDQDLDGNKLYELQTTSALHDLGGESVEAETFVFQPASSGQLYSQVLDVSPGLGDDDFPLASSVSTLARNNVLVSADMIGDNLIELRDGRIELFMAQADLFPDAIPVVIRKGQTLVASGLKVALAGKVNAGLDTGDLQLSFVSDVTGYMVRNTHWPSTTIPDNQESPLEVFLNFDLAASAVNPIGNAVLTQDSLGVQVSGMAEVKDGALVITNLGSIELDLLGIAKAPVQMALSLATSKGLSVSADIDPPTLRTAYPKAGEALLELGDSMLLAFSEAVELSGGDAIELRNEFGSAIEADMRASGSMVVITPAEPLVDNVDYSVFINSGLRDLSGNSWRRESGDPTDGEGVLRFHTAALSSADALGPALVGAYPGAPCALVGQGAGQRRCQGGDSGDGDYLAFEMPANHKIEVLFDKAVRPTSVTLGTACGQGAFRVEQMTGTTCDAAVPGLVQVSERGIQFVPEDPWQEGVSYRLRLIGGINATCGAAEICGDNGLPLNTDPLAGNGAAGGPDVQIFFTGSAATKGSVAVTSAQPVVDRNGNGKVDTSEAESTQNRASVGLAGVTGIVSSASLDMSDCDPSTSAKEGCMYMSSDLVVVLGENQENCVINAATETVTASNCIPATISAGAIYGTELTMDANVLGLGIINNLKTGRVVLRVRESSGPVVGYIVEDAAGNPEILLTLSVYMDAPDLSILGGLASHDLHSKELRVALRGAVEFGDDGRLRISVANEVAVDIQVGISALGLNTGSMSLRIAPGGMALDLMTRPARGGQR